MSFSPIELQIIAAVMGLAIGSFLNVVIYRLPKILECQWAKEAASMLEQPFDEKENFNLAFPRSNCRSCGHTLAWYENIPILSYVFLRGKCSSCKATISVRYPLIEMITGGLFYFCFARWGHEPLLAALLCIFCSALLILAMIDWDTTLLPDNITLPLLWLGLIGAATGNSLAPSLSDSLWGAVAGYLSLWLIYWIFKLITGKEGMGYGDFKLFAVLGVWFGYQLLVPIILLSSVVGLIVAIILKFKGGLRGEGYIPFGPFLAGAGFLLLFLGPDVIKAFILGHG